MTETNFEVGQRVQSMEKGAKKIGTVKYIGPVQGYEGIWAGVDWDDGERRHNGTVNGVRYFGAAGDKSASFVRLHSLSKGVTFLEALLRRYKGDSTSQEEQDEMYVLSASQKRVSIELVGVSQIQEKQMHLENLFHVSLEYAGVSSPGSTQEISGLLPKLEELDLRGNLLPDLHALGLICEQLPALRVLDISDSHMKIGSDLLPMFSNLRTLVLNNCGITWEQVEKLKRSLPTIEELHLGGNKLRTIEVDDVWSVLKKNDKSMRSRGKIKVCGGELSRGASKGSKYHPAHSPYIQRRCRHQSGERILHFIEASSSSPSS